MSAPLRTPESNSTGKRPMIFRVQSPDDRISVSGDPLKVLFFQIGVRHGSLLRQGSQPLVKRNFLEFRRDKHFEEHQVLIAGVLDVMAGHRCDEALKSIVRAFSSPGNTVIRPLPLIQYCHSLPLGCQCIARMQPGFTVTIADAIFDDAGKFLESMIFALPALLSLVGFIALVLNV
jgi:hypothetical protein